MLKTKNIIPIDPKNRFSGIVYMSILPLKVEELRIIDEQPVDVVEFTISFGTLQNVYRDEIIRIDHEDGSFTTRQIIKCYPTIVEFRRENATFRASTFYGVLGNPIPSNYYEVFKQQIDYVNSKTWTGSEIQQAYYWELTSEDVDILTESDMVEILAPYEFIPE